MRRFVITVKGVPSDYNTLQLKKLFGLLCGTLQGNFHGRLTHEEVVAFLLPDLVPEFLDGEDIFITVEQFGDELRYSLLEVTLKIVALALYEKMQKLFPRARVFVKIVPRQPGELNCTSDSKDEEGS